MDYETTVASVVRSVLAPRAALFPAAAALKPIAIRRLGSAGLAMLVIGAFACASPPPSTASTQAPGFQLPPGAAVKKDVVSDNDIAAEDAAAEDAAEADDVQAPEDDTAASVEDTAGPAQDSAGPGTDVAAPDAAPKPDTTISKDGTVAPVDAGPKVDAGTKDTVDAGTKDAGTDAKTPPKCVDEDNDGFGDFCPDGDDCDDSNENFTTVCPDCKAGNVPGCPCKGKSTPCYTGDTTLVGKGVCAAGVQACNVGFWGTCTGDVLPDQEKCDNKDNDCDGLTDEGVKSTCGTCDLSCNQQQVGVGTKVGFDLNSENSTGVGKDPSGAIVLDPSQISINLKYIWIANSPQSTVSKLNCKTGQEVGRFQVCSDPSRTSVDLQGNVWVGCRGDGGVAKIMAEDKDCTDKNGDGAIQTSKNSGVVGNDECIRFIVKPDGPTVARGAAVDKDNHVWMGFWNTQNLHRLEPDKGASVDKISIPGCHPYGLVIDQKGIVWAQGAGCGALVRIDPKTKNIQKFPYPAGAYGLNVDKYGHLWVASAGAASRFDPKTMKWTVVSGIAGGGRGVATSNDGYVYVAGDGSSTVTKINALTAVIESKFPLGGSHSPVGIALDYDGFVWTVNQGSTSASKMDPKNGAIIGNYKVGQSPYTYSDMTGYTLNYFTAPKGQFTALFFGSSGNNPITVGVAKHTWEQIDIVADTPTAMGEDGVMQTTSLTVKYRAGDTAKALDAAVWVEAPTAFPPAKFPYLLTKGNTGAMLQVEVHLLTTDKKLTPALKSVTAKSKIQ